MMTTERSLRQDHDEVDEDGHQPDRERRRHRGRGDEGLAGDEEREHESVEPSFPPPLGIVVSLW